MDEEIEEKLSEADISAKKAKIQQEKLKLEELFKDLKGKKKKLADGLIEQAAYLRIELQDLKKHNVEYGIKEVYMNGQNQFGNKESVESKTYNNYIKQYLSIIKQLNDMLPIDSGTVNPDDEFDKF